MARLNLYNLPETNLILLLRSQLFATILKLSFVRQKFSSTDIDMNLEEISLLMWFFKIIQSDLYFSKIVVVLCRESLVEFFNILLLFKL